MLRDNYKCKMCGDTSRLHAHHIIARKTLQSAEFIRANGVTLCKKCHNKTDSWGGGKDIISYNRKGRMLGFIIKIIPHGWQDYETLGNYFFTKDGFIVILVSDMGNDKYNMCIVAHEMFESALVWDRKIPVSSIDDFDINNPQLEDPGLSKKAPYHREHMLALKIEKILAKYMKINWKKYEDKMGEVCP